MTNKLYKVKHWVKVGRLQTAMVTALALWVGYVSVSNLNPSKFASLAIVGVLIHVWGFMLNEVYDYEYDKMHGTEKGHPIAQGEISQSDAVKVAWSSGILGILLSTVLFESMLGNALLILSFGAGIAYNRYSKEHWWSNLYLSLWVLLLSLAGAAFAGGFTKYSWMLAIALAIQIFVQVIEGDMKDIIGPENTMAERMGVCVDKDTQIITYPSGFRRAINGLKMVELSLVTFVVYENFRMSTQDALAIAIFTIFASIFVMTSTMFMKGRLNRDSIKEMSSVHELSSILMIGTSTYWLHFNSSIFIALIPVAWYAIVNKAIHTNTLNPDI